MIKYMFFSILCISVAGIVHAQQKKLNGTVKNAGTGSAIPGATIKVPGATVMSNADGDFSLPVRTTDTLLITHAGFEDLRMPVKDTVTVLTVWLTETGQEMEAVTINTGYQRLKPNEVNGSYVVIDNKTLNLQSGTNILSRLNGVTSSLLVNMGKKNNNPQNSTHISIRGLSTINGPLDPLIVVDNFIYEGDINNINPNDVESITILKDAAAASIWGARAGNGVIVITTKKGRFNQKVQVDFNSNVMITQKPDLFYQPQISIADYVNFEQFLFNTGFFNSLLTNRNRPALSPAVMVWDMRKRGLITAADSALQMDALKKQDSRDQFTEYYYRQGLLQQYALNLRGGGNNIAWLLSGTYDNEISSLRATNKKVNLRFENTYRAFKNLTINTGAYYTNRKSESGMPAYTDVTNVSGRYIPYLAIAGVNGEVIRTAKSYNLNYIDTAGGGYLKDWNYYPLTDYLHNSTTTATSELLAHAALSYQLARGLKWDVLYQYQRQSATTDRVSDTASYYTRNLVNLYSQLDRSKGLIKYIIPAGGILNRSYDVLDIWNARTQLGFDRTISDRHYLAAIAGMELRSGHASGNSVAYYGYQPDPLIFTPVDFTNTYPTFITGGRAGIPGSAALSSTNSRFVSQFFNALYSYKKLYSISASMRRDGSNIFGATANNKWKPLWSVGAGWEVSKQLFYKSRLVPYLKLSVTYGVSGNVDLTKTALPVGSLGSSYLTGFNNLRITNLNNPDLGWERSYQTNLKLDFGLVNNVLTGSLEYYLKKGTGLYAATPYDYTAWGYNATIVANVADMKGRGIDVVLHSNNINRAFKWSSDFLFNYNTNKTTQYYTVTANPIRNFLGGGNTITPVAGKPLYAIAAYKWGGLDTLGNPQGYIDGKKSIDYAAIRNNTDRGLEGGSILYIGSATPVAFGSVLNSFSWKGFTLSMNITYKMGYYLFKPALSYYALANYGTSSAGYDQRWLQPGDEQKTNIPSFRYPISQDRDNFYGGSEVNVIKGDHIRLQFITLSYSFLNKYGKLPFKNIQVYGNAANIGIIWRANKDGIDPDYINAIPASQSYTIGIRTTF